MPRIRHEKKSTNPWLKPVTIALPSVIQYVAASSRLLMPRVAMNELTLRPTTTNPLTAPTNAATRTAASAEKIGFHPSTWAQMVTATATPQTPAKERSKTPAASGMMTPSASMAVIADWPATIERLL